LYVALAIALAACGRVLWVMHSRKGRHLAANNDAVVYGFHEILRYFRFFNTEMAQGETAMQFAAKIDTSPRFDHDRLHMRDVASVFLKARYSGREVQDSEREVVERARNSLDARTRLYAGRLRYLYYKYILAVI
ncbi:MAG: DUF4129 domain-containing protein, partial [Defluviitaleaceae bacterium]|nr:DUF4129 domain-containing protein [Defluviitaleaceae bacterium]